MPATPNKLTVRSLYKLVTLSLILSFNGCANFKGPAYEAAKQDNVVFSAPLRQPKNTSIDENTILKESANTVGSQLEILRTPTLSVEEAATDATETVLPVLADANISRLTFNNMPVGAFINEVFGNQLGLNYVVEPSIKNAADLVTMRLTSAVSQKNLYELATQTLTSYGVTTALRNNILTFDFSEDASNGKIPLIISGRALPEVPSSSRPVFLIYTLSAVTTPMVRSWLTQIFPRKELEIKEDPNRNALILVGTAKIIEQAIAATKLLDRPTMSGMHSRIVRPTLSTVTDLASNLEKVLQSEGFAVKQSPTGSTAIRLLPLESIGQLVIFAASEEVLQHIVDWTKSLETERYNTVEQGLFSYQVQSTQAIHIVQILNSLGVADYQSSSSQDTNNQSNTGSSINSNQRDSRDFNSTENKIKGRYAVDEQLNTILYSGNGKDWLQVLPVIKRLDKPAPSVMVEVIVAEIQLNDSEETGLDWLAKSSLGGYSLNFASSGVSGLVSSMFDSTVDTAGGTRALLNVFYSNNKANIRSRPRIMVKSGGEATINVGDKIPVISQTSQSTTDSNAVVIQTVSYRDTGVILSIKPTVHASGFVDIEIDQEISTASGDALTPTISNRSLSTTVTLRDGGSVLLGGLIASNTDKIQTGIPLLGKIPYLGRLFSSENESQVRTELMIMIIPYVLNSPDEAERLTDELQQSRIEDLSAEIVPQSK